jgi:hypothetical protein
MVNIWHQNTHMKFLPMENTICALLEVQQKLIIGLSNGFVKLIDINSY